MVARTPICMKPIAQDEMAAALDRLWEKFLQEMRERAGVLESAAAELACGQLSGERRQEAQAAAHKLAGVLGSFGMDEGTELAREAEGFYSDEVGGSNAGRLKEIAARLRSLLDGRG